MLSGIDNPLVRHNPSALQINSREYGLIARNILRISGRPEIGIELGTRIGLTSHGFLGYAFLSSSTLREATDLLLKYSKICIGPFQITESLEDGKVNYRIEEFMRLGCLRQAFHETMFTIFYADFRALTGMNDGDMEFHLEWPEPEYYEKYRHHLPRVHWQSRYNEIKLNPELLELSIPTANESNIEQVIPMVERELNQTLNAPENIVKRVRAELRATPDGYPSLDEIARRLNMSASSLKRKLKAQGTQFRSLLDEVKQKDALHLIKNSELKFGVISEMLGVSDPATFTRKVRRWTNKTPREIRSQLYY